VVLIDLATDLGAATEVIRYATSANSSIHVIGLHTQNDSEAILRSLRSGASEFLYAPFEVSVQEAAISRIQKLLQPASPAGRAPGKLVVFSSAKPGSGASTLAVQTAHALRRATNGRVVLIDLDLLCGSAAFFLNANPDYSVIDVLRHSGELSAEVWSTATVDGDGIDVLAAPEMPFLGVVSQGRINEVLEAARGHYDWVVVDLPSIFHPSSVQTMKEADHAFLVSTPELASLHLARRAVTMLTEAGVEPQKFQVLINRMESRDELSVGKLSKLFNCKVNTSLSDDKLGIQRVLTTGKPLAGETELGRAIDSLAGKLMGAVPEKKRQPRHYLVRPAFAEA
jgi:pilus assembly protein CpaE